jgi:hypothetical protein
MLHCSAFMQPLLQCKTISIAYSEYAFVAYTSSMQCACAILPSMVCPTLQYYSTLSFELHDFERKKLLTTKLVFWRSLQFLPERIIQRDRIINVSWSLCKVDVNSVRL